MISRFLASTFTALLTTKLKWEHLLSDRIKTFRQRDLLLGCFKRHNFTEPINR